MTTATVSEMGAIIQKVTTVESVMEWCKVGKKAYSVIENLKFFLKTKEDITSFISKFEDRFLWQDNFGGLAWQGLAREVGSYHYGYENLEQLEEMDVKDALERLFNQPLNSGKIEAFKASKVTLRELFEIKQTNPRQHFMSALR
jgi:hypothetical protein